MCRRHARRTCGCRPSRPVKLFQHILDRDSVLVHHAVPVIFRDYRHISACNDGHRLPPPCRRPLQHGLAGRRRPGGFGAGPVHMYITAKRWSLGSYLVASPVGLIVIFRQRWTEVNSQRLLVIPLDGHVARRLPLAIQILPSLRARVCDRLPLYVLISCSQDWLLWQLALLCR